jgi:hypothetical protein
MVDQSWVIEVKAHRGDKDDAKLATTALNQIKETNYGGGYKNPVLLGLAVNDKARAIIAWESEGGLASKPAKSALPVESEEEGDRPGPKPR